MGKRQSAYQKANRTKNRLLKKSKKQIMGEFKKQFELSTDDEAFLMADKLVTSIDKTEPTDN